MKESRLLVESLAAHENREDMQALDLRKAVIIIRKYKWLLLAVAAICTLFAMLAAASITPIYKSSVTILFADSQAETGFERQGLDLNSGVGGGGSFLATQLELINTRGLAEKVVNLENLTDHWEYNPTLAIPEVYSTSRFNELKNKFKALIFPARLQSRAVMAPEQVHESAVWKLVSNTSAAVLKRTDLVRITVKSADPALAARIANGYGAALEQYYLAQSASRDRSAQEFLAAKVDELKRSLISLSRICLKNGVSLDCPWMGVIVPRKLSLS
jgi:uncharacterized protein involved in exopolysaccharide biosynthesis